VTRCKLTCASFLDGALASYGAAHPPNEHTANSDYVWVGLRDSLGLGVLYRLLTVLCWIPDAVLVHHWLIVLLGGAVFEV